MIHHSAYIHPKSHVDNNCRIGAGTKIWQFASLTRGVVMGEDCSVSPFVMLDGSVYGDRVVISAHFAAGAGFKVGNDVFIAPGVTLANDMWPRSHKNGYDDQRLRGNDAFSVVIEDGATIGAHAVILPGVTIGAGSIVGAGCIVDRSLKSGLVLLKNGYVRQIPDDIEHRRMRWVSEGADNG